MWSEGDGYVKTPIYEMRYSDGHNRFFIKREDLLPFSLGGNKARKAALFFEDMEKGGYDCVLTYGSSSSNHLRIVANMAASKGIPCHIVSPDFDTGKTNNSRLVDLFGARVKVCSLTEVKDTIRELNEYLSSQGYRPYFIPGGGHGNLGTQAYVQAYDEICEFEKLTGQHFDYIYHASGTGTTQAGLVCGSILSGDGKKIIGISIARKNPYGKEVIAESINAYLASIDFNAKVSPESVDFVDSYVADGYGSRNQEILNVIRQVLISDGILLDSTYTGKAFYGMKEHISKMRIRHSNILFIHTGGTPLFFDDLETGLVTD